MTNFLRHYFESLNDRYDIHHDNQSMDMAYLSKSNHRLGLFIFLSKEIKMHAEISYSIDVFVRERLLKIVEHFLNIVKNFVNIIRSIDSFD